MSGATKLRDLQAGTSGMMDSTAMETEEYYNQEGGESEWSQKVDTGQLCRVCANPNEYLIPIFDGEGLEHELAMKIQKHLPIKVTETDTLPLHICYQCASTLIAWHDLVISCVEADKKLRELQVEDEDEDDDKGAEMFESHSMDSDPADEVDQPSTSEVQSQVTKAPLSKKASPNKEKKPKLKMVLVKGPPAGTSGQKIGTKTQVAKVLEQAKSKEGGNEDSASERCESHKCLQPSDENSDIVNNEDQSVSETDSSKKTKSIKNSELEIINDIETSESTINVENSESTTESTKRMSVENSGQETRNNDTQLSESSTDDNLSTSETDESEQSQPKIYDIKKFRKKISHCNHCGKIFRSKFDLEVHVNKELGIRPHVCHICGRQYLTASNLKHHIKISHEKIKNYECGTCKRKFAAKDMLADHVRTHTGERPLVCDMCGKTFASRACLSSHRNRIHLNVFPHTCSVCNKKFARPIELHYHILTHTGEKPHACNICDRRFRTKNSMVAHLKCHSDVRPFVCDICGRAFKLKKHINAHCRTHQKDSSENEKII